MDVMLVCCLSCHMYTDRRGHRRLQAPPRASAAAGLSEAHQRAQQRAQRALSFGERVGGLADSRPPNRKSTRSPPAHSPALKRACLPPRPGSRYHYADGAGGCHSVCTTHANELARVALSRSLAYRLLALQKHPCQRRSSRHHATPGGSGRHHMPPAGRDGARPDRAAVMAVFQAVVVLTVGEAARQRTGKSFLRNRGLSGIR